MIPALKKLLTCLLLLFFIIPSSVFLQTANAQSASSNNSESVEGAATLGIATLVPTTVKNVKDGSVLSNSPNGAILANTPYDPQVLGIVSRDAAIAISTNNTTNTVPVISNGTVYVLVSSQQGNIKK